MKAILLMVFVAIGGTIGDRLKRDVARKPVPIEDVPYSVTLFYNNIVRCGGALISEKHVLTAAHCLFVFRNGNISYSIHKDLIAVTGTIDPYNGGNRHRIEYSAVRRKFITEAGFSRDIAVLTLVESVTKTPAQKPIDLPDAEPSTTRDALFVGIGCSMLSDQTSYGRIMRFFKSSPVITALPTTILTAAECRSLVEEAIHDDNICGGYADTCRGYRGDSGGPLVQDEKLVGVLSWSINKSGTNIIGFINVKRYLSFIKVAMTKTKTAD